MGRAAQLTIAGVAGVAGVVVVTSIVGPMVAFAFSLLGLLLKVSFIILVGYIVLTLLKKREEPDGNGDQASDSAGGDSEPPSEPTEPIEVEVDASEEDE